MSRRLADLARLLINNKGMIPQKFLGDGKFVIVQHQFHFLIYMHFFHGTSYSPEWRREEALDTTLENDLVRVRLDETTGRVVEFLDKRTGEFKCVDGGFDFVEENPDGMSAWTIGPYMKRERAARRAYIRRGTWGPLRQSFDITEELTDRSTLRYRVSLDQGSPLLTYDVTANWREFGSEKIVPMLLYGAKLTTEPREFSYSIAGGTIARPGAALDFPVFRTVYLDGAIPSPAFDTAALDYRPDFSYFTFTDAADGGPALLYLAAGEHAERG